MMKTVGCFGILFAAACAANGTQVGNDELAGESNDGEAAKADSAHDNFDYLLVEKTGQCTNPITCAPYTLTRVNRSSLKCADGNYHDSCKVKGVSFAKLSMASQEVLDAALDNGNAQVLVKGTFKIYVDFSAFEVSEGWMSQIDGGVADGTWVRLSDSGIRCITTPCPVVHEERLNSTRAMNIDGLDWGAEYQQAVTSPGWLPNRVTTAMSQKDGAIVVGYRSHGDRNATLRTVEQVFLPLQ